MGKAGKIILGGGVAIIAIVVIAVVLVFQNLDSIIKSVIEGAGTQATGTAVRVSEVKFTLQEGRGEIYGLTIANPPGYSGGHLFEMGKVAVQLEPRSLAGPVIVINEVLIDGAKLSAEQKGTRTNIQDLMDNLQSGSAEAAPAEEGEAADVRLMMEKFAFTNSTGTVKTQQFGERELKIPDVRMSDVGDRSTGLSPQELANQMLSRVVKQVEKAVRDYLEDQVKDAAKEELNKQLDEKIGAENREKLEGLKSLIKKN
jgi:hypothetical protein